MNSPSMTMQSISETSLHRTGKAASEPEETPDVVPKESKRSGKRANEQDGFKVDLKFERFVHNLINIS